MTSVEKRITLNLMPRASAALDYLVEKGERNNTDTINYWLQFGRYITEHLEAGEKLCLMRENGETYEIVIL